MRFAVGVAPRAEVIEGRTCHGQRRRATAPGQAPLGRRREANQASGRGSPLPARAGEVSPCIVTNCTAGAGTPNAVASASSRQWPHVGVLLGRQRAGARPSPSLCHHRWKSKRPMARTSAMEMPTQTSIIPMIRPPESGASTPDLVPSELRCWSRIATNAASLAENSPFLMQSEAIHSALPGRSAGTVDKTATSSTRARRGGGSAGGPSCPGSTRKSTNRSYPCACLVDRIFHHSSSHQGDSLLRSTSSHPDRVSASSTSFL